MNTTWNFNEKDQCLEITRPVWRRNSAAVVTAVIYASTPGEANVYLPGTGGVLAPEAARELGQAMEAVGNLAELTCSALRAWGGDTEEDIVEAMKRKVEHERVTA